MTSSLTDTALIVNGTQEITSISDDTLSNRDDEVPTSAAVIKYLILKNIMPKVGGVIFDIESSTNTYTFYDANGNQVFPTVGTDCSNYYYYKSGSGVDKYYVYNTSAIFPRNRDGSELNPYICWSYISAGNQSFIDGKNYTSGLPSGKQEYEYYGINGRVYESLDGTYTGTAIGTGKSNTQNMMSLRGGVYVQGPNLKWNGQTQYSETIWSICNLFNKGLYNLNGVSVPNTTGCNDWYIPSKDELETMKNAIGASTFASMLYSGDISSAYIGPWSSSAYSAINHSWHWWWSNNTDIGMVGNSRFAGNDYYCLALTRSF